jgi:hypothetical protein
MMMKPAVVVVHTTLLFLIAATTAFGDYVGNSELVRATHVKKQSLIPASNSRKSHRSLSVCLFVCLFVCPYLSCRYTIPYHTIPFMK